MPAESGTQPLTGQEQWYQPGTYSVWAYDRYGEGQPILLVLYTWEVLGLRGLYLASALGELLDVEKPKAEWDGDYTTLRNEVMEPSQMTSLQLIQLIRAGNLHFIGLMPKLDRYKNPPSECK